MERSKATGRKAQSPSHSTRLRRRLSPARRPSWGGKARGNRGARAWSCMHFRRFVLGAKWRLFGLLQSARKSRNSGSKDSASAIMRGIGNQQQKQPQARNRNLKPSQIASDEECAVMGKGTNV